MSEITKVKAVVDPNSKQGANKKGQTWTQAKVELENGATTYMFAPISVGDEVESYQNGEYVNWRRTKLVTAEQARADGQLVVVINMLKDIGLAVGAKFAMDTELTVKSENTIAKEAEEDMDEEIDLSTIPF